MIKVITWFRRKPGLSVDEFQSYWRNEHPKAVLQLPGLRKYVQNHVIASQYRSREPHVDGVAETWWDDRAALDAHRGTPALDALMVDEAQFMSPDGRQSIVAEEVVVINGGIPPEASKMIVWITRRPDMELHVAQSHWRTTHAEVASKIPGMARYVQNHARPGKREPDVMGLPMTWFASADQMRANATSPELAATRADEPNFLVADRLPFVLVKEHHII